MAKTVTNVFMQVRRDNAGNYYFIDPITGKTVDPNPEPAPWLCQTAFKGTVTLQMAEKSDKTIYWKQLSGPEWTAAKRALNITPTTVKPEDTFVKSTIIEEILSGTSLLTRNYTDAEIREIISNAIDIKPNDIFMQEVKWKYLVHSTLRAQNILLVGDSGAGKTVTAKAVAKALRRPFQYFNLGATQDARATLIGNTHVDSNGTTFDESLFIKTLRTPYAIILLDELTRGSHDAWNILMPVLDPSQRYLRLDEKAGQETVEVAEGVSFISTANIGRRFTATKMIDDALFERNQVIEMDLLSEADEKSLLMIKHKELGDDYAGAIAKIAATTRAESRREDAEFERYISTRMDVKLSQLITDGFSMPEAYDACVFPFFSTDGNADSERTFITQIAQQHMILPSTPKAKTTKKKSLFSDADMNQGLN